MSIRIAFFALAWLAIYPQLFAHTTTIALTGTEAVGTSAATWSEFGTAALNNEGALAFSATLQHNGEIITVENDAGIWLYENSNSTKLAQTGVGNVPEIATVSFGSFERVSLSHSGDVAVSALLVTGSAGVTTSNHRGIWRYNESSETLVARTGSGNVGGIVGASFADFIGEAAANDFALAGDGQIAVAGSLTLGGGVLTTNNRGLWQFANGTSTLIAREGVLNVPDIPGANFKNFSSPVINSNDQTAVFASLKTGSGGVTSSNAAGIWRYNGSNGELLARSGSGNVPDVAGLDFVTFEAPRLNDNGQVAFRGVLSASGGTGVWLYSESTEVLLARSQVGNVPGAADASFLDFAISSINNSGQVLTLASLEHGPGGVSAVDDTGLWLLGDASSLVARTGSENVAGVPEANFAEFYDFTMNEQGMVAFSASMQLGEGEVDATNDRGIWLANPSGDDWLVARKGDLIAGHTIETLHFWVDEHGQSSGLNDLGELAFQATFTDGGSGVFLFRPFAADFNRDGEVDATDRTLWTTAYHTSTTADADLDGDTDGADFLAWQRDFGSSTSTESIHTIPEPASGLLFAFVCFGCSCRRRS